MAQAAGRVRRAAAVGLGAAWCAAALGAPRRREAGAGAALLEPSSSGERPPPPPPRPLTTASVADAAAAVAPAVVNLRVGAAYGALLGGTAAGSGFVVDARRALVVSNAHVVRSAAKGGALSATLPDGRTYKGTVLYLDKVTDVALVRLEDAKEGELEEATLGSSRGLRAGEWVVAVGSPLTLTNSVTAGIVSSVDRKGAELGLRGGEFIQTDASINQGNSGGPLVNLDGEVIGVCALKAAGADGVSFAIPIDTARDVMRQLLDKGRVARPFVGVKMLELTPQMTAQLRERDPSFPRTATAGILVPMVLPGSPAQRAGVRPGDVIVSLDGVPVSSTRDLIERLGERVNERVAFGVLRPGAGDGAVIVNVLTEEAASG